MKRIIYTYGGAMAILATMLKLLEYAFIRNSVGLEVYLGTIGIVCAGLGAWFGAKWFVQKEVVIQTQSEQREVDRSKISELGISQRELEVLSEMAKGLSN